MVYVVAERAEQPIPSSYSPLSVVVSRLTPRRSHTIPPSSTRHPNPHTRVKLSSLQSPGPPIVTFAHILTGFTACSWSSSFHVLQDQTVAAGYWNDHATTLSHQSSIFPSCPGSALRSAASTMTKFDTPLLFIRVPLDANARLPTHNAYKSPSPASCFGTK